MKKQSAVFQFKVTLDRSVPRVWRRIVIAQSASFFDLHIAIQDAMGWGDGHLHSFTFSGKGRGDDSVRIEFPDPERDELYGTNDERDERVEKIADFFGSSKKQCQYLYDFGDNWSHTVLFEKAFPAMPGVRYPQCIAGKNACPPEDCGGVWGYQDMLEIIKDKKHPEHKDMLNWMGIDEASEYDPTVFDAGDVEFRNVKKALKEYEKGFGVPSIRSQKQVREVGVDDDAEDLSECLDLLKQAGYPHIGTWELAQRVEPLLEASMGKDAPILTLVVDEASYFILNTRIASLDDTEHGVKALLEAMQSNEVCPKKVLVRDVKLVSELDMVAKELDFTVEPVKKLKVVPIIFRDMTRLFGKKE